MRAGIVSIAILALVSPAILAEAPGGRMHSSVGEVRGDTVQDLLIGKWQPEQNQAANPTLEFRRNGKIVISAQQLSLEGTYKFLRNDQIEVKLSLGGVEQVVKLNIKLSKNEMTATPQEGGRNTTEKFKRLK